MDPNIIYVPATGLATVAGLGYLVHGFNTRRTRDMNTAKAREEARRRRLFDGRAVPLRPAWEQWTQTEAHGQIATAWIGTYATRLLPMFAEQAELAGAEGYLGWRFLMEPARTIRAICLQNLSLAFRSKVVAADLSNFPEGMLGASIQDGLARRSKWEQDELAYIERFFARLEGDHEPAMLLVFLSPAGSACLALLLIQAWKARYDKPIFIVTIVDDKTPIRQRFADLLNFYDPFCDGFIVMDNRRHLALSDAAITQFFAAWIAADGTAGKSFTLANALVYLFRGTRIATVSALEEPMHVHYEAAWQKRTIWGKAVVDDGFYANGALVEEKAGRLITKLVTHPELQSIPLPASGKGHTRLCVFSAPVRPKPDIQLLSDRITQDLKGLTASDPDLSIRIGSIGAHIDEHTTEVPARAVLLQPLAVETKAVGDYASGNVAVDPRFSLEYQSILQVPQDGEQDKRLDPGDGGHDVGS